jgi:hypothetical protein
MYPSMSEFNEFNDKTLAEKYSCSVRTVQRWRSKLRLKAGMYGVSQAAIGRVVNNISYPEKNVGISGTSPCVVSYFVN